MRASPRRCSAKPCLPDDLPWVTGSIGLLGTKPSYDLMTDCDTLLMIGSGFPYAEFLPKEGAARGVQIDIKADMLSLRYPMEVNLVGDSARDLACTAAAARRKAGSRLAQEDRRLDRDWWKTLDRARARSGQDGVNPQRTVWELSKRIPSNAIVTSDSGSCANWYARDLKVQRGMMCSLSGGLASMGAAVPYAIAAKFAYPERPVVALVGDGAMQMNNMAELITVAKYWQDWANPRWICMVLNNEDLNQVTWEQRVMEGDPKFEASQDIPSVPYHKFAELIGLKGIYRRRRREDGRSPGTRRSPRTGRSCIEVKTDPNVAAFAAAYHARAGQGIRVDLDEGRSRTRAT